MNSTKDVHELLQEELTNRIGKNAKYSLRAFARALEISPATLSLLLARKTPLSKSTLQKIAKSLSLPPDQEQHLKRSISKKGTARGKAYKYVTLDFFNVLSEWYYFAILSLLEVKGASLDSRWIAKKLGISIFEAKEAVERLKRLDLIAMNDGKWRQTGGPIRIDDTSTISAARRFQKQLLTKAIDSLENDPVEIRDFSSMTFSMKQSQVPLAVEKITGFRRALVSELEEPKDPDSVYNLTIQLFPVTKETSK